MPDIEGSEEVETTTPSISPASVGDRLGIPFTPRVRPNTRRPERERTQYDNIAPGTVLDMIGQENVRRQMLIALSSARREMRPTGHILLTGPMGLGKTTLARMVSTYNGKRLVETDSLVLSKPKLLVNVLSDLRDGDVLLVDEIHRLTRKVTEGLYKAMTEFRMNVEQGTGGKTITEEVDIAPFTLVAATTEPGSLLAPLFQRFKYVFEMEYYSVEELANIVNEAAGKYDIPFILEPEAAVELAMRSRGTPRVALSMLEKARDVVVAYQEPTEDGTYPPAIIDMAVIDATFELFDIDNLGLTLNDHAVLRDLLIRHGGGPVGINNLTATTGIDPATIRNTIEPWLIRCGFMSRGITGRVATAAAYEHLEKLYDDIPNVPGDIRRGLR